MVSSFLTWTEAGDILRPGRSWVVHGKQARPGKGVRRSPGGRRLFMSRLSEHFQISPAPQTPHPLSVPAPPQTFTKIEIPISNSYQL